MTNYRGLNIPRTALGANVTTDNLFDPNEQVIFDFYEANRGRYRRALDIGANIGVHSILMARLGWEVRAFEPDPEHFAALRRNASAHGVKLDATWAAVADFDGVAPFIRVLGNTTASHLEGARAHHGLTEKLFVPVVDCRPPFKWADFAKIDCEGSEAALIAAVPPLAWSRLEIMIEVGSEKNARAIYNHLRNEVPLWAQKIGWRRVERLSDMPVHHSEGSLFIGAAPPFPQESHP